MPVVRRNRHRPAKSRVRPRRSKRPVANLETLKTHIEERGGKPVKTWLDRFEEAHEQANR